MLPKEIIKQLKYANKMHTSIAQNMPIPNNPEATQDIQNRLDGLNRQLQALLQKFESSQVDSKSASPAVTDV